MILKLIKKLEKRQKKKILRAILTSDSVKCDSTLRVRGGELDFMAVEGAVMECEKLVMLNSDKDNYPLHMHSPVKIRLLKPEARLFIGEKTRVHGSSITCYERVSIGKRCLIAGNTAIMDAGGHRVSADDVSRRIENIGFDTKPVIIQDDVWLGANCIILPGVTIGRGSIIAAGSVVCKDIPAMCIAGGSPAKVIKSI